AYLPVRDANPRAQPHAAVEVECRRRQYPQHRAERRLSGRPRRWTGADGPLAGGGAHGIRKARTHLAGVGDRGMEVSAETVRSSTVAQRPSLTPVSSRLLQRKCACGGTGASGECDSCRQEGVLQRQAKDSSGPAAGAVTEHGFGHDFSRIPVHPPTAGAIQTRLTVNEPGDVYEQEADRIADQVLASPAHPAVSGAPPQIQRFSGQSNGQMDAVPTSVSQALASPGRPLEPALRQDMEQRFGHDFSRVRVHTDGKAADSAHAVSARAYTVGHDIVFAAGQYDSGANEGRKLIAHELTHTIQQSVPASAAPSNGMALQRQGVPGSKPAKAEESDGESLFTVFVADEKKRTDKAFAKRQA